MSTRDPYALIASTYDGLVEPFLKPIKRLTEKLLQKQFNSNKGILVLDLACGTGSQACLLAQNGFRVLALEKSPGMFKQLRKKARTRGDRNILPVQGDLVDIPIASAMIDAVVVQLALHEIIEEHRRRCISEIKRVTKENAVFIFVDFAPTNKYTPAYGLLTLAELAAGNKHYHNGRDFLEKGGLIRLIQLAGLKITETFLFFQGNLCLAVAFKNN